MKKRDLLRLIESQNRKKGYINEDFYYGDTNEDIGMMSRRNKRFSSEEPSIAPNWEEDEDEDYDMPPGREEPGMPPGREDDDTPRPRHRMSSPRRMNDPFAPVIEPGIKEPKIKPKEPDVEPEWAPDEDEPIIPSPDVNPEPQARRRHKDLMRGLREEFNRNLNRLDNVTHKHIKYRKY